ncbi:MAG: hypothetical protein ACR2H1_10180 [Limisphaerales bacterium]
MSSKDKINVEEIQSAINALLNNLRASGIREVELKKDYYWEIDSDKIYDVATDPSDLSIGSLFDDWESIQELASGKSEPVFLLIDKVSPLLRYIVLAVTETQLSSKPTESSGER